MSIHQKKDGRWYIKYRDQWGIQQTEYFGRDKEGELKAIQRDAEVKYLKRTGQLVAPNKKKLAEQTTMLDLVRLYLRDRKSDGASERFVTEFGAYFENHLWPLLPHKPIDRLGYRDFSKVVAYYDDKSPSSRNRYMTYLKASFNFAIRSKMLEINPLKEWKRKKEPRQPVQLTIEDFKKIYAAAAPHLKWVLDVEWNLGTRPGVSELFSIKWENVDFDNNLVNVWGRKAQTWRKVPISDDFKKKLLENQEKTGSKCPYVLSYKGRQIKRIQTAFENAVRRAGIPYKVRPYDVRHLFATTLLKSGADIGSVSALVGHASRVLTVDTYYHVFEHEKRDAIEKLPGL